MKKTRRAIFAVTVAALLSACTDSEILAWKPETDPERELRLSRERLQRTVGEGALAGAATGAAVGALVGGVGGAFSGAQIGQAGGAAAGNYVRALQEQYANEEAVLAQATRDIEATNAELERAIQAMRGVLAEARERSETDTTRRDRNAVEAAEAVRAAEARSAFFGNVRSVLLQDGLPVSSSEIDPQLARLRERIQTMREISESLASS